MGKPWGDMSPDELAEAKERSNAANRRYYQRNRQKVLERTKAYAKDHRDERNQREAARRAANPEAARARESKWRAGNRERLNELARARYAANREGELERKRKYREANRDLLCNQARQLYWNDPEKVRAQKRSRYAADPTPHLERHKQWADANPEIVAEIGSRRDKARQRELSKQWKQRNPERSAAQAAERTARSRASAERSRDMHRAPWTPAEEAIAMDRQFTASQASLILGRSIEAVRNRRRTLRKRAAESTT